MAQQFSASVAELAFVQLCVQCTSLCLVIYEIFGIRLHPMNLDGFK